MVATLVNWEEDAPPIPKPKTQRLPPHCQCQLRVKQVTHRSAMKVYIYLIMAIIGTSSAQDCFDDFAALKGVVSEKDPATTEIFKICPGTTFVLSDMDQIGLPMVNGTIYQCGENGDPTDECVISGGLTQILTSPSPSDIFVDFNGITFEDAFGLFIGLQAPGEITFTDCIIRKHEAFRFAVANYRPEVPELASSLSVVMDGCLFSDNLQKQDERTLPLRGMFNAGPNTALTFKSCLFTNNTFAGVLTEPVAVGYISLSFGGNLTVEDSCILGDNKFAGFGTMQALAGAQVVSSGNWVDPALNDTNCTFIAEVDATGSQLSSCVDADADSCSLFTNSPSMMPTIAPQPMGTPSMSPTVNPAPTTSSTMRADASLLSVLFYAMGALSVILL